jgi:cysteine desulfurase/selenocysteine lyase
LPSLLTERDRQAELDAFRTTPAGREKPSRYWKFDLEQIAPHEGAAAGTVAWQTPDERITVCAIGDAQDERFARAFRRAIEPHHKFAHLALAHAGLGAFIHVPAGVRVDEPIVVTYRAEAGESVYPYTVVLVEAGAQATIVERLEIGAGAFVCGVAEVVTEAGADITYASAQLAPTDTRILFTRAARPGRDARVAWANAELGGALAVSDLSIRMEEPGIDAHVATLFFPLGTQHVDIVSSVDHRVGDTTSETIVKSAAAGNGQGRYLGNIRIAAHAQHSNASLRDDALLLSKSAHIDSIPALEIAANDVKAYHGATVGALLHDEPRHRTQRSRTHDRAGLLRTRDRPLPHAGAARRTARGARGPHRRNAMIGLRERSAREIAADFPILAKPTSRGKRLVYLDSAATSQKPRSVIDALVAYYSEYNANIHRGVYEIAARATDAFEASRATVARFINAADTREIIFTRNATESINLVGYSWGMQNLRPGDVILTSEYEHHSNLVPWQLLAEKTGATLRFIPVDARGVLELGSLDALLQGVKLLAISHVSNTLGTITPLERIIPAARAAGATILVDGAQGIPHLSVDVQALDVDFYAFSGHKMLGPTGIGVLYGRRALLEAMPPFLAGGDMIRKVAYETTSFNDLPWHFEAGTSNIADAIALGVAIEYLEEVGMDWVRSHEKQLLAYALERLAPLESRGLALYGPRDPELASGVLSFNFADVHAHDLASILDTEGICIRAGHHCTMPLMDKMGWPATARASFYIYNDERDVDALADGIEKAARVFKL